MFPVRRTRLVAFLTGMAVTLVAIVVLLSTGIAGRLLSGGASGQRSAAGSGGPGSGRPGSGQGSGSGTSAASAPGGKFAAVPPSLGLRPGTVSPNAAGYPAAEAALPKLDAYQLAGQRVIWSYPGLTPPATLLWAISHGRAAGVIFFKDNVGSNAHIAAVVKQLQAADAAATNPVRLPLLLMTDQEGGLVRRLSGPPDLSAKQIGESATPQNTATKEGTLAGTFMHGLGVNVNLAPVLDVYRTPGNFIDEFGRSFSNKPGVVSKLGRLFLTAMQAKGVAATVKHFPGLGAATRSQNTDERPVTLNVPLTQLRAIDEAPYKGAIAANVKLAMVSWAVYPALDKKFPAGLSRTIVLGELRNRLGFAGVTITDALEAGALKNFGSTANRAVLATNAGMDLVLCSGENPSEGSAAMHALR
ncbi:MAG TPA: glycoside hydrolase family 3 N-terminal domain-containing protein, partial [Streptosporangiaceae bacterium]